MKAKLMMLFLIALLALPMALASLPGNYWGKAYISGNMVPNGETINAYINDELVASAEIGAKLGSGYYEIFIEGIPGEVIIFKIGNAAAGTAVFSDGAHPQLDLILDAPACGDSICNGDEKCSSCAADCGACPSDDGGSSGGSSGGSGGRSSGGSGSSVSLKALNSSNASIHVPEENESLGAANLTSESSPGEENNESVDAISTETKTFLGITGAAIGDLFTSGSPLMGILVMLLIVGLGLWLFIFFKRRSKKGKK